MDYNVGFLFFLKSEYHKLYQQKVSLSKYARELQKVFFVLI